MPQVDKRRLIFRNGMAFSSCFHALGEKHGPGGIIWLLAGGLLYTVGGVIYGLKNPT